MDIISIALQSDKPLICNKTCTGETADYLSSITCASCLCNWKLFRAEILALHYCTLLPLDNPIIKINATRNNENGMAQKLGHAQRLQISFV